MQVDEKLRLKLLKEEFKLRKMQPTPWTKTKYRAYANFRKPKDLIVVEGTAKTTAKVAVKVAKSS